MLPMGRPFTPMSLQGRLTGLGGEDLPTIVIVAHYDAFGVAPVCPCPSCPAGESSFRLQGSRVGGVSHVCRGWATVIFVPFP